MKTAILLLFYTFLFYQCSNNTKKTSSDFINNYNDFLLINKLYQNDSALAYKKLMEKLKDTTFSLHEFKKKLSSKRSLEQMTKLQERVLKEVNSRTNTKKVSNNKE